MKLLVTVIFLFSTPLVFAQRNFSITGNGAGGVILGMTVAQARRELRGCQLKRTSDGEGIALIGVTCSRRKVMTLFAGEDDTDAPINEKGRIEFIEIWDKRFKTANGIHKGMLISEAERRVGRVKEIVLSPIESREYVTFSRQPKGISYRIYGGIFKPHTSSTKKYTPGTRLWSIQVNRN